eukprot:EG_transcript_2342
MARRPLRPGPTLLPLTPQPAPAPRRPLGLLLLCLLPGLYLALCFATSQPAPSTATLQLSATGAPPRSLPITATLPALRSAQPAITGSAAHEVDGVRRQLFRAAAVHPVGDNPTHPTPTLALALTLAGVAAVAGWLPRRQPPPTWRMAAAEADMQEAGGGEAPPPSVPPAETFQFRTETRQILDIVAQSLYTEREVFIRELISNAADAMERRRYLSLVNADDLEPLEPQPQIRLEVDGKANTFTIQDTGIGMTKAELLSNLGTIASSGSRAFLQRLQQDRRPEWTSAEEDIIGQFGVGFYSVFMVCTKVEVHTRSCYKDSPGYIWESDGYGTFTIAEEADLPLGTRIVLRLKPEEGDFSEEPVVRGVIRKYSNFVGFPVFLNGQQVNTVEALWRRGVRSVTDAEHQEFFKYISNKKEPPLYWLHYTLDAPLDINAVLYIPRTHAETPETSRLPPNFSLYCKKVMIKSNVSLLPEWMRFIIGVVDSEDLPLNVSRQEAQDTDAVQLLKRTLTRRVIKWLGDEAERDREKYNAFFRRFANFFKEGACNDTTNGHLISKLLRFESSRLAAGQLTSFDEYISRMLPNQRRIFFLHSTTRERALASPYYEVFERKGIEVLLMTSGVDEYVVSQYESHMNHPLCSAEDPGDYLELFPDAPDAAPLPDEPMTEGQCARYAEFLQNTLKGRVVDVLPSARLFRAPALVVSSFQMASAERQRMQFAALRGAQCTKELGLQVLEFNPRHPINKRLLRLCRSNRPADLQRAAEAVEQLFDNGLIAAGLLEDPRAMLQRLDRLLEVGLRDVPADAPLPESPEEAPERSMISKAALLPVLGGDRSAWQPPTPRDAAESPAPPPKEAESGYSWVDLAKAAKEDDTEEPPPVPPADVAEADILARLEELLRGAREDPNVLKEFAATLEESERLVVVDDPEPMGTAEQSASG